jgi:uncharacterized membrane protein YdjX (TVP38/TMEM64 family)
MVEMKTRTRIAVGLLLVAGVLAAAYFFPLATWASGFIAWVRGKGATGALVYGSAYIAGTVLLIPGTLLTAGGGFLYGSLLGVLLVSPASVAGATISFLLARSLARDWTRKRVNRYPQWEAMDRAVERHGFKIVFLLRLEPFVISFVLLNYALGLTRVRLRDYVLASWLGMLPATIFYVYLGSSVKSITELVQGKLPAEGRFHGILLWAGLAAAAVLIFLLTRMAREVLRREFESQSETHGKEA